MRVIDTEDLKVIFADDQGTKDKVFDKLIEWYEKRQAFVGESIMQDDDCQIYAADVLATIADDIIKFDVEWKE